MLRGIRAWECDMCQQPGISWGGSCGTSRLKSAQLHQDLLFRDRPRYPTASRHLHAQLIIVTQTSHHCRAFTQKFWDLETFHHVSLFKTIQGYLSISYYSCTYTAGVYSTDSVIHAVICLLSLSMHDRVVRIANTILNDVFFRVKCQSTLAT